MADGIQNFFKKMAPNSKAQIINEANFTNKLNYYFP